MVEDQSTAWSLFQSGEIDNITLAEDALLEIYKQGESSEWFQYLVEAKPTKYAYQIHFNYDSKNEDGTLETNWNTAIANKNFRLCWYYGIDWTDYIKRYNYLQPGNCIIDAYTAKSLAFTSDGTDYYYPERTIVFHIDNPNGANVSVVGASTSSDISIYRLDNVNDSKGTITQVYSMRCKTYPNNTGNRDKLRGFTYDLSDHGHTSDVTFNYADYQSSNNALFAHIFKLPAGDYCIGATSNTNNSSGGTANIFFLAVQGQTDGTLGTEDYAAIGSAITNVDFLISAPSISKIIEEAYISFKGEFNSKEGTFAVNFASYIELIFLEDENSIVRYLLVYSYGSTPRYLVNGTLYTVPSVLYKGGA